VSNVSSDYVLFLNNDTEVITDDWLEAMVEQAQRPSIGVVGALLYYPDNTVQHAGVIVGLGGVAGHGHKDYPRNHPGYFGMLRAINNFSALTAACVMMRRAVFEEAGGFDESLAVAFNDVDLCLRIRAAGYHNVYLPHVALYHFESKSRGGEDTAEKHARFVREIETMERRWATRTAGDPCYSPHLSTDSPGYKIRIS
jgi:GT2 family glycosyltransferase